MARLIDADDFTGSVLFADADVYEEDESGNYTFGITRKTIIRLLDEAPTVDAVPVVRCEKCNYGHWLSGAKKYACRHPLYTGGNKHSGEHSCSSGERRKCNGNA